MICSERDMKIYILKCKGLTLKEVGEICQLSPERVRQIFNKVLKKLENEEKREKQPAQLKKYEKQMIWALHSIIDDIKNIAEK